MRVNDFGPDANSQLQTYLRGLYTSSKGIDYTTFKQIFSGTEIALASFSGLMGLFFLIFGIPY